jgi:hypothetical protein
VRKNVLFVYASVKYHSIAKTALQCAGIHVLRPRLDRIDYLYSGLDQIFEQICDGSAGVEIDPGLGSLLDEAIKGL